jgi:glycosyltransferase involved in cell wall biosynthesis
LVEPGDSGWLVPAGSVSALAQALREVLETPLAKLDAMGQRGAAKVGPRHNAHREAAKLVRLFRATSPAAEPSSSIDPAQSPSGPSIVAGSCQTG